MYDSIDGRKVGILKNVDSTCSDSIYAHKDSVTVSNNKSLVYAEAPEFKEPITIYSPRYSPVPINPDYLKLAQIAYNTVLQTMLEGEKEHGADGWKSVSISDHIDHAFDHIEGYGLGVNKSEDHIAHAMTRCAMIKYLEVTP